MSALTILIIRHAEKPEEPPDQELGVGVSRIGAARDGSLVVRGWQRAGTVGSAVRENRVHSAPTIPQAEPHLRRQPG